jgi:deazaflavin-dependent oxidoreductase (nitroreductase family)
MVRRELGRGPEVSPAPQFALSWPARWTKSSVAQSPVMRLAKRPDSQENPLRAIGPGYTCSERGPWTASPVGIEYIYAAAYPFHLRASHNGKGEAPGMRKPISAGLHSLTKKFAASRAGIWLLSRILHHLDRLVLSLTGERGTLTAALAGVPIVVLTTRGAKSGLLRSIPLLPIRDAQNPEQFALVASNWGGRSHPAWYFNLKAHPQAHCAVEGRSGEYTAHEVSGEEYHRLWERATRTYFGFRRYQQRAGGRHIPIMVMVPSPPAHPDAAT